MSMVTINQYWENEAQKENAQKTIRIQYATVIELTRDGAPIIQFAGDSKPSQKTYPYLQSYMPTIGDRIILLNNFILGSWIA